MTQGVSKIDVFLEQGTFEPLLKGHAVREPFSRMCIVGMGGSRLAGSVLRALHQEVPIHIHASYGLPTFVQKSGGWGVVISSFSGDTAEALDAYHEARSRGFAPTVITGGGALLQHAEEDGTPHILLPPFEAPPREAVVLSLLAHAEALGFSDDRAHIQEGLSLLQNERTELEETALALADFFERKQVISYAHPSLVGLGELWKINFNETTRYPCSLALLPEANHGEVEMFDGGAVSQDLTQHMAVLGLGAKAEDPRLVERLRILAELLLARGVPMKTLWLTTPALGEQLRSMALSLLTAHILAERGGVEGKPAELIVQFKDTMRRFDFPG